MRNFLYLLIVTVLLATTASSHAETPEHFQLRSDAWMNLHHFLYHAARAENLSDVKLRGRVPLRDADTAVVLEPEACEAWDKALATYAEYADRDLLFDAQMAEFKLTVGGGEAAIRAAAAEGEPLMRALLLAMPVYRQHWWDRHDALNRQRISELRGLLDTYGQELADWLGETYESSWPEAPIHTDIVVYANRQGAYTSSGPNRIVMSSSKRHAGLAGLEILFHEAAHTLPLGKNIRAASIAVAERAGVDEDRLWHSYIFHASGEAVRRVVDERYVPYADANGLWQRGSLAKHQQLLSKAFGKGSLAQQFERMHELRAREP